ncbi:hypothetical protein HAZT_HAZT010790 [Hyalella azteca]|uniref:EGF-like domain-containing protein n=1 Tax=Hyalella azteca TaxID=294128 RepID=A0A6A0GT41_HYAAZ|nr:hypothetical protein HAZT_HAZT010790 [Hyalella azteca]
MNRIYNLICGNGTCDHRTGACVCASGWRGPRCDRSCPEGRWGYECANACRCHNGGECKPETGEGEGLGADGLRSLRGGEMMTCC